MTAPAGPEVRLRGGRCLCRGCGHLFGSPSAFDRHQHDDGRVSPCRDTAEFTAPHGKSGRPRLVWDAKRSLWITRKMEVAAWSQ